MNPRTQLERIIEGGFIVYVDLLLEEDGYRSVRRGFYTKDWVEVNDIDLMRVLEGKIRNISAEFCKWVTERSMMEDEEGEYVRQSMCVYGNEMDRKKALRKWKKGIVCRTKLIK